ncbi:Strictosidine synthase 1 [Morus notabilis]|uniref:Strictosidine synthase 1 n=1 Tax=Morus notabilis TaxID=981085 RepID=W9ST34_9ROSA|nr:protein STRICTOSIDINE SYNTHASE-LIKE 12 [Morus notabilis]EXC25148.1 Strictosidine synthase 1 [Morus notabilis]
MAIKTDADCYASSFNFRQFGFNETVTMLLILLIFLSVPSNYIVLSQQISTFRKLNLPTTSVGPEPIDFDALGRGPYTGISDGRIVRYDKRTSSFVDFAFASQNRSKAVCDGTNSPALRPVCGRPLGIEFFHRRNLLFIADAFAGLCVVGPNGGLATQLATTAEGISLRFLNGLSVDQHTGDVYFTDYSSRFLQTQIQQAIAANDSTGRLLKYDYRTKNVTVLLLRGLSGANGVAISSDGTYLLFAESIANRTQRFWLRGARAFTSEVVANFQGMPRNIRRTPSGDFLVGVSVQRPGAPSIVPTAIRINGAGQILQTLPLDHYYNTTVISEFLQRGSRYYAGSAQANFVGVFNW